MEIIVVDNASSDGSAELVENNFPQARLIRNPANLGFAKANNLGIAAGTGRYVCLINSDVKVLPDCISRLVDYCEQNPMSAWSVRESSVATANCNVPAAGFRLCGICFVARWHWIQFFRK